MISNLLYKIHIGTRGSERLMKSDSISHFFHIIFCDIFRINDRVWHTSIETVNLVMGSIQFHIQILF